MAAMVVYEQVGAQPLYFTGLLYYDPHIHHHVVELRLRVDESPIGHGGHGCGIISPQALTRDPCLLQVKPDDAFGRQMCSNLESRGCPLRGLASTPTLEVVGLWSSFFLST